MRSLRPGFALSSMLLFVVWVPAAFAQAGRSFVSAGSGSDSNPCTRTLPCRSFGTAIGATLTGGEVIVLDSGGYGPVGISHSISIVSPAGVYAGITGAVSLIPAISISAPITDRVVLEGLTLNSTGSHDGIDITSAGTVVLRNVRITGFPNEGINLTASSAVVIITGSEFLSNGDAIYGKCTTQAQMLIDNCSIAQSDLSGVILDNFVDASISNSLFIGNGTALKISATTAGATSQADVERCIVTKNFTGIRSGGDAGVSDIRVSNSTITMNVFGLITNAGSTLKSRGNNTVEANSSDGAFTGTITAK